MSTSQREELEISHNSSRQWDSFKLRQKVCACICVLDLCLSGSLPPFLSLCLLGRVSKAGGGADSESCDESRDQRRTYKSRSVIDSESESEEELSSASKKARHSKEPKHDQKGTLINRL